MSKDGVCRNIVFGSPVRCQTKVHNCKYSYLLWYFIVLLSKNLLLIEFCFINSLIFLIFSPCPKYTSLGVRLSNDSWNDFRHARKLQTIRETTSAKRGNIKPFGKWLSPCAETPNHSGNDFRHARKCQTFREMTFAMRGNAKPFGKRLSPCAEMPNLLRRDLGSVEKRWDLWKAHKGHKQKKRPFDCSNERSNKRRRLPTLPHCIAVPSAQVGLTSLFGMGRGGTPPQ